LSIQQLEFCTNNSEIPDFEIIDIQNFFNKYNRSHLMRNYRLGFWLIIYVTSGFGEHFIDFKRYTYKSGDILLFQKNQVHHFVCNNSVQGYIILIKESYSFVKDLFRAAQNQVLFSLKDNDRSIDGILELLFKEYCSEMVKQNVKYLKSLLVSFLLLL